MAFSPDYVRIVLNENFEDAKTLLLDPMMALHEGHLVMLAERGIVSRADARRLRDALSGIDLAEVRAARYAGTCEDLFFYVDGVIAAACGVDVAARLHTARSRNDMAMTMYRMRLRGYVLAFADSVLRTRASLATLAERHVGTIYPAHTHTQPAQPTTVAHYLLAVIEELERHTGRLFAAFRSTNRNPLGACAITGTAFPIDRDLTSDLLGFDGPTGNTYGSIATIDYLVESAAAAANTVLGLGRFVQDMLLWCTVEMGYLRLSDGFVQVSSIMPQKRNPVALEHARSLLSKALTAMQSIPVMVHNTPFGDINDTEDDLQPLVAGAFKDALRGVDLVAAAMAGAEFDVAKMRARAAENWVTVTELADTLAREHGLPFGVGHGVATRVIHAHREQPDVRISDLIAAATRELGGREVRLSDEDVARVLSPEHFIAIRRTHGGPAPDVVTAALRDSATLLATDAERLAGIRSALAAANERRARALKEL
jgi:argininosuccinate lyase